MCFTNHASVYDAAYFPDHFYGTLSKELFIHIFLKDIAAHSDSLK